MTTIRIGARESALSQMQTTLVLDAFRENYPGLEVQRTAISTAGDRKRGTNAPRDKKDWIYDLELALLDGSFDAVVHSAKDVPSDIEPGTLIIPVLERESPFDVFVGRLDPESGRQKFETIPSGALVGTASLRRKASILRLRPDVTVVEHRGNVTTRLEKLDSSRDFAGIVLAEAGVRRLGIQGFEFDRFSVKEMLPAINQGILVVQILKARDDLRRMFEKLSHPETVAAWRAERAVVTSLNADCDSCVGIFAECNGPQLNLEARVMLPDGSECITAAATGSRNEPERIGKTVREDLLRQGADAILERSRH